MNRGLCLHTFATHVLRLILMHTDGYRCILKFAAARFALDEVAVPTVYKCQLLLV